MESPSSLPRTVAFALATFSLLTVTMGCNRTKVEPVSVSRSTGPVKLTPQEVETRIRGVQASTSVPESAKPGIIQSIRAQGQ